MLAQGKVTRFISSLHAESQALWQHVKTACKGAGEKRTAGRMA